MVLVALFSSGRATVAIGVLVYLLTCLIYGFRFKASHVITLVTLIVIFNFVVSPLLLYIRNQVAGQTIRERAAAIADLAVHRPPWYVIELSGSRSSENVNREDYYEIPGTTVLSRLSLIRSDSNMISVCSSGYRYGWTTLQIDFAQAVPHVLYKDKPSSSSSGSAFTGRVTGLNSDGVENAFIVLSPIADAYGSFGLAGVSILGLFVFPFLFLAMESLAPIRSVWGILVIGTCYKMAEGSMGEQIAQSIRFSFMLYLIAITSMMIVRTLTIRRGH